MINDKEKWVIYVKSATPQEAVSFEGAYLFFQKSKLGSIELLRNKKTPFKLTKSSDGFTGTFTSNSQDKELLVILAKRNGDYENILTQKKGKKIKITEYDNKAIEKN
jgi:hypothetical protein